jgi:hypothetical protein
MAAISASDISSFSSAHCAQSTIQVGDYAQAEARFLDAP